MRLEFAHYETNLNGIDTADFVIPEGYELYGVSFAKDFPNTCHQNKPILILTKDGKYFAQCACGENLTATGADCGSDALIEYRNTTR